MSLNEPVLALVEDRGLTEDQQNYTPSDKERKVIGDVFEMFRNSATDRNRNFEYFDGSNLIQYIEDSVKRFTTNYDSREDIEDWQARINDPFTRNKVLTILGKVNSVLPIASFKGRGSEDVRKASILNSLYEYAEDVDDYDELMLFVLLEAIVKGTAIGYEGVSYKKKKLREVHGVGDNLKITTQTEITTKLPGILIPLEEFYPSSVSIRNIKSMPYCFWRKEIPYSSFIEEWREFKQSKFVSPFSHYEGDEERPYYLDYISGEVAEGNVELIRFYDKDHDEYVILANGVWLNPIGNEVISPLPFNHKDLPFWDIKFDFFGDFFYGKSLPDRLKSMQDVLNVMTNMLLDQSFLTVFPPILTNGYDTIEEDYLRPGRRTPIDTQGLPISQAFAKLDLGTPSGWHQYILEYTRKIMEEASIDQVSSGQAGVGGRTTAQEIRVAAEGVASVLSLFGRMVNYGIKRKALLKTANILQFWTNKKTPVIRKLMGGAKTFDKVFNTFKVGNTTLSDGKRGTKIIELYGNRSDIPTKVELQARGMVDTSAAGKNVEIIALPGEYLRDFQFDVELVSNPKKEMSQDIEKALQLEKVRVYMSFFPQQVDMNELAAETAEIMGDDPTKILKSEVFNPQPATPAGQPGQPGQPTQQISTNPQQNTANNVVRSNAAPSPAILQLRQNIQGL